MNNPLEDAAAQAVRFVEQAINDRVRLLAALREIAAKYPDPELHGIIRRALDDLNPNPTPEPERK